MAVDIATLSIKCDSSDIRSATSDMNKMAGVGKSLMGALSGLAAIAGIGQLAKQFYDINSEFQRLGASLVTVEGSVARSEKSFALLQRFAATTPYELSEVTQAYIDLRTRGLDASLASMTNLGNYASSFGRSLSDMVRAISGVVMGETEAIKSFGVRATAIGDKVALSFKGVTTIVKRTAGDIQDYFDTLSDKNFSGGMERQMATIGGAMSNLKDQIASTFFAIGNAGVGTMLADGIRSFTQAISDVTPALVAMTKNVVTTLSTAATHFSRTVKFLWEWKTAIVAIAGVAFASTINAWVASVAALIAPMIRTIALTLAMELGTINLATSFGIAQAAAAGFRAVMTFLISPAGLLTAGIVALTLAMSHWSEESRKAEKAFSMKWDKTREAWAQFYEMEQQIKDMNEEREAIVAALKGGTAVKPQLPKQITAVQTSLLATGEKAEDVDKWIKKWREANDALKGAKDSLEARNQAMAKASQEMERQAKVVESLKDQYNKLTLSEDLLRLMTIEKSNLTPKLDAEARSLAALIFQKEKENEADKIRLQNMERYNSLAKEFSERPQAPPGFLGSGQFQNLMRASGMDRKADLDQQRQYLEANKGMLTAQQYSTALRSIRHEQMVLAAESGDLWAQMGLQVESFSDRATDALVDFFFTGKNGFAEMVDSMLRDMARLVIQQNITGPLFSWLGKTIGSVDTTMVAPGGGKLEQSISRGSGQVAPQVFVNVSQGGGVETTTKGGNAAQGKALGDAIGAKVREVLIAESRSGGLLNPA